jgi:hypothetical protein
MDDFVRRLKPASKGSKRSAFKGFTIYVHRDLFTWIDMVRGEYGMTRQDFVEQLIKSGAEQFKAALKKEEE